MLNSRPCKYASYVEDKESTTPSQGPVTIYNVGNISNEASRAFNKFELLKSVEHVDKKTNAAIDRAYRNKALSMLAIMKKYIAGHAMHNHNISIDSRMGSTDIMIDGRYLSDMYFGDHKIPKIVLKLREIDQCMENSWEWASHLDKKYLGGRKCAK